MSSTRVIEWNGDEIMEVYRRAAAKALLISAEYLLGLALNQVPIDEGTLQDSGQATVDAKRLMAVVSFDTPYAVDVHEDLNTRHAPGRKAKFLEDPMLNNRKVIFQLQLVTFKRAVRDMT